MKLKNSTKGGLLAGAVVAGLLVMTALANQWALGSFNPPSYLQSATNATLTTNSGPAIFIPPGAGMNLYVASQGNSTNALTITTGWDVSGDGVIWTTTTPFKLTNTIASGAVTVGCLQLYPSNLWNYQFIKETYLSQVGSTTAITNNSATYSAFY